MAPRISSHEPLPVDGLIMVNERDLQELRDKADHRRIVFESLRRVFLEVAGECSSLEAELKSLLRRLGTSYKSVFDDEPTDSRISDIFNKSDANVCISEMGATGSNVQDDIVITSHTCISDISDCSTGIGTSLSSTNNSSGNLSNGSCSGSSNTTTNCLVFY